MIRRLLPSALLLCCTAGACGENSPPPGGATGGQSGAGSGGAPPDEGGVAGGAGGAGGELDGAPAGAGGSGNAGGANPTDAGGGNAGCAGIVSFADPNVERAAVESFDGGPVLAANAQHLDFMRIQFTPAEPLTSLKGLECFTGLTRLDISGPDLPSWGLLELAPLASMTSLQWLDFHFDPAFGRDFGPWPHVLDLSPIGKLSTLSVVRFDINAVQDITVLGSLTFQTLFLYSETLSDLSPLAKVTGVESALVRGKSITDVAPLATALSAAGAKVLITKTSISDVSPLAALTNVRGLSLPDNLITDISPLVNLPTITLLQVEGNPLQCPTQMVHIQALQARGVRVTHSCNDAGAR
jgi:hypothetical protein